MLTGHRFSPAGAPRPQAPGYQELEYALRTASQVAWQPGTGWLSQDDVPQRAAGMLQYGDQPGRLEPQRAEFRG